MEFEILIKDNLFVLFNVTTSKISVLVKDINQLKTKKCFQYVTFENLMNYGLKSIYKFDVSFTNNDIKTIQSKYPELFV